MTNEFVFSSLKDLESAKDVVCTIWTKGIPIRIISSFPAVGKYVLKLFVEDVDDQVCERCGIGNGYCDCDKDEAEERLVDEESKPEHCPCCKEEVSSLLNCGLCWDCRLDGVCCADKDEEEPTVLVCGYCEEKYTDRCRNRLCTESVEGKDLMRRRAETKSVTLTQEQIDLITTWCFKFLQDEFITPNVYACLIDALQVKGD